VEGESVPSDWGTGETGPKEDRVAEGGGPNDGVLGLFGRYGEGKALFEVPKYGELYGEPYGESFSTTQPLPCCTTRVGSDPLPLARMLPPVHLDLAPLTFVGVGGTRPEDRSTPLTTSIAFAPTRTAYDTQTKIPPTTPIHLIKNWPKVVVLWWMAMFNGSSSNLKKIPGVPLPWSACRV